MKSFPIFALLVSIAGATEKPIAGGYVRMLEFDFNLNTYAVADSNAFFKINKNNAVEVSEKFKWILKILVNSYNDVYIFTNLDGDSSGEGATVGSVWRLKSNSNKSEFLFHYLLTDVGTIESFYKSMNYFIDKDDNIFFNTKNGVALFRSGSRTNTSLPIAIENLDGYFYENYVEDEAGNVFLSSSTYQSDSIAVITKSAKNKLVPDGMFYPVGGKSEISGWTLWGADLIVVDQNRVRSLKKDFSDNKLILSNYNSSYTLYNGHNGRLFINSKDESFDSCRLHIVTSLTYLITVEDFIYDCSILSYNQFAVQKDGTGYFLYAHQLCAGGYLLRNIYHNETKFGDNYCFQESIVGLAVDDNDNLWILGYNDVTHLYAIPKGSTNMILVHSADFFVSRDSFIKFKTGTNEIVVASGNGVYVLPNTLSIVK